MKLSVALCTYNGHPYLEEQLSSILSQTVKPDEILVSDDGSNDGTLELLKKYSQIKIIENTSNIGVIKNFERCLAQCTGDFIFISDQDDVWAPNKIEVFVNRIQALSLSPSSTSMLYSDLTVVDSKLRPLIASFIQYANGCPQLSEEEQLKRLVMKNWIPGCSSVISRGLRDLGMPFPDVLHMHDHWLALLALSFGKLEYIDQPLVKYRQHGKNSIGAHASQTAMYLNLAIECLNGTKWRRIADKTIQAESVLSRGQKNGIHTELTNILLNAPNRNFRRIVNFFRRNP